MATNKAKERNVISEVFTYLKSRGFLEQLRLECIADVKKKPTYLKLKKRVNDYLVNKWSNKDWQLDPSPVELSTCREQIVECCVLAITIESVIDLVVSRKLQEVMQPMLQELINGSNAKRTPHVKRPRKRAYTNLANGAKSSLSQTVKAVKKMCETTEHESKKMLENGFIGHTLASVTFPKTRDSDDDCFSVSVSSVRTSDLSSYESDICLTSDDEDNNARKPKAHKSAATTKVRKSTAATYQNRSRRERKLNPKYSSSLYHTSYNPTQNAPAPITASCITNLIAEPRVKIERLMPDEIPSSMASQHWTISSGKITSTLPSSENKAFRNQCAKAKESSKSCPKIPQDGPKTNMNATSKLQPVVDIYSLDSNCGKDISVRKSERKRKLNSRIFSDSTSPYFNMMNLKGGCSSMKSRIEEVKADIQEFKKAQMPEPVKDDDDNNSKLKETKRLSLPSKHQKYDSSDLYKPRPVILPSGSRMKKGKAM